jgi:beta-lactamase class D
MRVACVTMLLSAAACGRTAVTTGPSARTYGQPDRSACFLLHELGVGEVRRAPAEACNTRVTPASTFKIPHALAALDSGIVADANVSFPFEGSRAAVMPDVWKREHTLATAMRYSVVWYFQRVATKLGVDREREYLVRFNYGNRDSSSGLTTFWLDESLRISPEEQEQFLVRLYDDALPVSKDVMRTVREILVQPPGVIVNALGEHPFDAPWSEGTVVGAKTGSSDNVTWLVGSVRRQSRSWVFVSCVIGPRAHDPLAAVHLAAESLRAEQVL